MIGPVALTGVLLLVLVLAWTVALGAARVRRLHHLHRRTDAARAGLEAALERRAVAALTVEDSAAMRSAVAVARSAGPPGIDGGERDAAENALGRRLAVLDRSRPPRPALAELVEAEQVLGVARAVHNDAVRDTLGLRSRRLVRWLHLAGTAPLPAYFEIAAPPLPARGTPAVPPR